MLADTNPPVFATGEVEVPPTRDGLGGDGRHRPLARLEPRYHGRHRRGTGAAWDQLQLEVGTGHDPLHPGGGPAAHRTVLDGQDHGIPALHIYQLRVSDQQPGHTLVWLEEF